MARPDVVRHARLSRSQAARAASLARLLVYDWHDLTAEANKSPRHVKSLDRWRELVRDKNPALNPEQVDRLATELRGEYFAELGRRSGAARRARAGISGETTGSCPCGSVGHDRDACPERSSERAA